MTQAAQRLPLIGDEFGSYPMQPQRNPTNWTLEQPHRRATRGAALRTTNETKDIAGATTGTTAIFQASRYTHKAQSLALTTAGIDGAKPATLHGVREHSTQPGHTSSTNETLQTSIAAVGAKNARSATVHPNSQRSVNPLNPEYMLPSIHAGGNQSLNLSGLQSSSASHQVSPSRVEKDVLCIDDIPGTRAKRPYQRAEARSPLYTDDIPKKYLPVHRSQRDTTLNLVTADILHPQDSPERPARGTDPNKPVYEITTYPEGSTNNLYRWSPKNSVTSPANSSAVKLTIGHIDGSDPRKAKALRNDRPMLSLRTEDVDGAKSGDPYKTKM